MSRKHVRAILVVAVLSAWGTAAKAGPASLDGVFDYNAAAPLGITVVRTQNDRNYKTEEITFASPKGGVIHAQFILPRTQKTRSGVLFVHWLGDPQTTNLSEFHRDAVSLAGHGTVALLVDAMWSQKDWYRSGRTPESDYQNSIKQVVDLRRALDVLLSQPGIDPQRIAYVGHDFGAMYGSLLAGVDNRVRWFVLMAGNPSFKKWYTYISKPKHPDVFSAQMSSIDPTVFLAKSKAAGYLFQFANKDFYISMDEALQYANSAPLPRGMFVYDAKHSLNVPEAFLDRIAWLDARLNPSFGAASLR